MAIVRKLSTEEVKALETSAKEPGKRLETWARFNALVSEMTPNTWVAIDILEGESKSKVRDQVRLAANRAGANVAYRRTKKTDVLYAMLITNSEPVAPEPAPFVATDTDNVDYE